MEPSSKREATPRLLSGEPLPNYAHIPGRTPHPFSDPAGHSHGQTPEAAPIDSARWETSRAYLRGLDLFNFGYFWEAHESWEALWRASEDRALRDFLKGLIQLAVAGVKHCQELPDEVRRHARRAAGLWRGVAGERYLGLAVGELIALAEAIERDGWPPQVAPLLP